MSRGPGSGRGRDDYLGGIGPGASRRHRADTRPEGPWGHSANESRLGVRRDGGPRDSLAPIIVTTSAKYAPSTIYAKPSKDLFTYFNE